MEKHKICSLFGHRKIEITEELKQKVKNVIEDLIINNNVSIFLFGSRSDFNYLCHLVVTELKEEYTFIKRIAYTCKHETCILESERKDWEETYSRINKQDVHLLGVEREFEYKTKYVSGKASYIERNQAMIDDSDYCVFYYDENYRLSLRKHSNQNTKYNKHNSGTKLAYNYAKRKGKDIINIVNLEKYI